MHKIWFLLILVGLMLVPSSGYAEAPEKSILWDSDAPGEKSLLPDSTAAPEKSTFWISSVTEQDVVTVVDFLINNKGREVLIAGEKHTITGQEGLDVEIYVLLCCEESELNDHISSFGEITSIKFPVFYATVLADKVQELEDKDEIQEIKFTPEAYDLWMEVIKQ